MWSVSPGNTETLHIEPEENHYSSFHLKISLRSAGSCIQSTDRITPNNIGTVPPDQTAPPKNIGSPPPGDTNTPNKQLTEDHCNSTHRNISLTSADSLNHKPDSVAPVDMESHTHKLMETQYNSACHGVTNEQAEQKNYLCMSEDSAIQNHPAFDETPGGAVTKNHHPAEALQEQAQANTRILQGNYYVHAAAVTMVAAAILWQLKK
ncbi:hypothetical protein AAFF_G00191650 [Aldrovandia affinis]|uniref:Uncharacterized protein n=1 Tax=Aldrovandia affinis TaxID=143900 RepID=A0AAD7RIX9_9TELE|nr:hypothetical protein AAFF_G00191650 [Aldrovandia affinis]